HHDQHVIGTEVGDRAAREVAGVCGQRDRREVRDGVRGRTRRGRRAVHSRRRELAVLRATKDPSLPPGRELDRQPVGGQLRHATPPTASAASSETTSKDASAVSRATGAAAATRRSTARSPRGSWARATATRGSARTTPKVAPTSRPPASEPVSSARAQARYTAAVVTTVTTPRPSWNPKPPPYTQLR